MSANLSLTDVHCKMDKYSNNTEFNGKDKTNFKRAWTLVFKGALLTREQFNEMADDPYADRAIFNINGAEIKAMPWLSKFKLTYTQEFDVRLVTVKVSGDRLLEFEACTVKVTTVDPQKLGGTVLIDFSVITHPTDKQCPIIDHHQYHEVQVSMLDVVAVVKKENPQTEMQLVPNADAEKVGDEALANGNSGSAQAEAYLDTIVHFQTEAGDLANCKRRDLPKGAVEIDPPKGSKSEKQQQANQSPEDLKAFQKAAENQVADFTKRKGARAKTESRTRRGH